MLLLTDALSVKSLSESLIKNKSGFKIPLKPNQCNDKPFNNLFPQDRVGNGAVNFDLYNLFNACYLATLNMGTPAQELTVLFDTGSSYTWLLSKEAAAQ
jgi:hypothetical protein